MKRVVIMTTDWLHNSRAAREANPTAPTIANVNAFSDATTMAGIRQYKMHSKPQN